mgnify:CR=1 FL=1
MNRIIHKITPVVPKAPKLLKVAAYARVSMEKETMLHSFSAQVSYYSEKIQKHPGWSYAGVYADRALTGTKSERPEFQRLLADCRAGKIDLVLTKSISRFARNTVTLLETVRELKALGIDVFFEEQNIHSMSGDGELMLTILASFAQEESKSVSDNCKWRIRKDFSEGKPMNLPLLYGYRREKGRIVIDEPEAEIVRFIFYSCLNGMGKGRITEALREQGVPCRLGGEWQTETVGGILKNEKYTGDALLQKTYIENHLTKRKCLNRGELPKYYAENTHPAIIDHETYERVQALIAERREKANVQKDVTARYPFTGLIVCGCCGQHYRRRTNVSRITWQCRTYLQRGKDFCPAKQIPEETLYRITEEALGVKEITEEALTVLKEIRIPKDNHLVFVFQDGREAKRVWKDRSRSESWTEEMREQARLHNLKRKKEGNQG